MTRRNKNNNSITNLLIKITGSLWIWGPVFLLTMTTPSATKTKPAKPQYQAMWVDAFNPGGFSPAEVQKTVAIARKYNVNTIFFQVCKSDDALYKSRILKPANNIAPNYDPLGHVLQLAHDTSGGKARIEVHAWITLFRVAPNATIMKGSTLSKHPTWRMRSHTGGKTFDNQLFIDPGVPAVQDYYASIIHEIVKGYPVDGIHLDRIRYPALDAGYNRITVKRFENLYKREDHPEPEDKQWSDFRRRQITDVVRRLYTTAKTVRPSVKVSAACAVFGKFPNSYEKSACYQHFYQNWPVWAKLNWLDMLCPMNYKREHDNQQKKDFDQWMKFVGSKKHRTQLIVGQGTYLNGTSDSVKQIERILKFPPSDGAAIYSYANPNKKKSLKADYVFKRIDSLKAWQATRTPISFKASELTLVAGKILRKRKPMDNVKVEFEGGGKTYKTLTDAAGFYAIRDLKPGKYRMSIQGISKSATVNITPGKVTVQNYQ